MQIILWFEKWFDEDIHSCKRDDNMHVIDMN